jgi:hypothetical protein
LVALLLQYLQAQGPLLLLLLHFSLHWFLDVRPLTHEPLHQLPLLHC